jgi:hypothetical protein
VSPYLQRNTTFVWVHVNALHPHGISAESDLFCEIYQGFQKMQATTPQAQLIFGLVGSIN